MAEVDIFQDLSEAEMDALSRAAPMRRGQQMYDSYAEASEDVVVCSMDRADVHRFLLGDARIAARIAESLGRRLARIEAQWSDAVFKSVPQRVAGALAVVSERRGPLPLGRATQVNLTHEQVAELAGTSRETATRILGGDCASPEQGQADQGHQGHQGQDRHNRAERGAQNLRKR